MHGRIKGRASFDTCPTARNYNVTLNATTFTVIAPAMAKRHYIRISNTANAVNVYIVLCPISDAVDETGIFLTGDNFPSSMWNMPDGVFYTGVFCGISVSGTPKVSVCEF